MEVEREQELQKLKEAMARNEEALAELGIAEGELNQLKERLNNENKEIEEDDSLVR